MSQNGQNLFSFFHILIDGDFRLLKWRSQGGDNKNRTIGPWLIWISWNPPDFMHEIRRISSWNPADFRPWNPADFMKSGRFHAWNSADFICKLPHLHMKSGWFHEIWLISWNLADFMKSGGFHGEIQRISSMKSGGFCGWSWKMQTWKCKIL